MEVGVLLQTYVHAHLDGQVQHAQLVKIIDLRAKTNVLLIWQALNGVYTRL